jgi:hypothetical protein
MHYLETELRQMNVAVQCIHPEISDLARGFLKEMLDGEDELKAILKNLVKWNCYEWTPNKDSPENESKQREDTLKSFAGLQRRLTERFHKRMCEAWVDSHPKENLLLHERINSIIAPESGRPWNVVTAYRPNHLFDREFIHCTRRRLLLPTHKINIKCADTDADIDPHMDHAFSCLHRGRGTVHGFVKRGLLKVVRELSSYTGDTIEDEPAMARWVDPEVVNNKSEKTIEGVKQKRGDIAILNDLTATSIYIDVRHCMIKAPKCSGDVGGTVVQGEQEKREYYEKNFKLPEGTVVVPFVIDAYGKWGEAAKELVEGMCRKVAGGDHALYNRLISSARETISLAHAKGVGYAIGRCVKACVSSDDYVNLVERVAQ